MVDALVDGFLARLENGGFQEATRRHLAGRRFDEAHAVYAEAIGVAFPQYARLAKSGLDGDALQLPRRERNTADENRTRGEADTERDPYRVAPVGLDFDAEELADTRQTVEIVVLLESLDCYNEIVRMFYAGDADEVHELEGVRRQFQKRYRNLVTLEELKAAPRPEPPPSPPRPRPAPVIAPLPEPEPAPELAEDDDWEGYGKSVGKFFRYLFDSWSNR